MKTDEMVARLRGMQAQIVHGTDFFGRVANRLEALNAFCHEVATDEDDRISPGLQYKAKMVDLLNK